MIILQESLNNLVEIFNISTKEQIPFIFPTDTIYGIGASIYNKNANLEIYKIKNRPYNKPFPILAGSIDQLAEIADISSLSSKNFKFFKENYNNFSTFIFYAKENLDGIYKHNNKVAIRIPNKKILSDALVKSNIFLTATSVNESEKPFLNSLNSIVDEFSSIKLFVCGKINNNSSNIYDITENDIVKIR